MTLTGPERYTQRQQDKALVPIIKRLGGCAVCRHRVEGWGASACPIASNSFPICLDSPIKQFAPDRKKLREIVTNASR